MKHKFRNNFIYNPEINICNIKKQSVYNFILQDLLIKTTFFMQQKNILNIYILHFYIYTFFLTLLNFFFYSCKTFKFAFFHNFFLVAHFRLVAERRVFGLGVGWGLFRNFVEELLSAGTRVKQSTPGLTELKKQGVESGRKKESLVRDANSGAFFSAPDARRHRDVRRH